MPKRSVQKTARELIHLSALELEKITLYQEGNSIKLLNDEYGQYSNQLTEHVKNDIESQSSLSKKIKILKFWLKTGTELVNKGDMNSASAIFMAINVVDNSILSRIEADHQKTSQALQNSLKTTIDAGRFSYYYQDYAFKKMIPQPAVITKALAAIDGANDVNKTVDHTAVLSRFSGLIKNAKRHFSRPRVLKDFAFKATRSIDNAVKALHDLSTQELESLSFERFGNRVSVANPEYGNHAKNLSKLVLSDIKSQKSLSDKTQSFEFWLKTAKKLEDRGDLNSACAVYSAVGSLELVEKKAFRNIASEVKSLVGNIDDKTINSGKYNHYMKGNVPKNVIPYPLVFSNIAANVEGAVQANLKVNYKDIVKKYNRIIANAKAKFPRSDATNTNRVHQILTSLHQETNLSTLWSQMLATMSDRKSSPVVLDSPKKSVMFNEEVTVHENDDLAHRNPNTQDVEDVLMDSTNSENTLGGAPHESDACSVKSRIAYFEGLSRNNASELRQSLRDKHNRLKSEHDETRSEKNAPQNDEKQTKRGYT